jgi:hypothetical protein
MKILLSIILALPLTVMGAPEIKKVCTDVVDKKGEVVKNKDGTVKQTCKEIKVRKKVEGKEVPDGTKK